MTETAKELIENEVKSVEKGISTGRQCGKTYKYGVREGLMIALAHIQNATTLVTSDETVTINKEVYDLLINKVNKQREGLEDIVFFSQGCYDSDYFANIAKKALAEIGGEDD
ncbi:hypothetical protein MKK30_08055 [Lactococcus formosensis]|uniref:hypothetical protein n=1 Tax=Lactococcus formosensis TaxID=1281486 RepID=UPI001F058534|nr:hypothetical protein [Lactococcus formosensis]MCH1723590.1 hypothetical protein [Lactococcus formosensis]